MERAIVGCWDLAITNAIVSRLRAVNILVEDLYCEVYNGTQYEQREAHNAIAVQQQQGGIERVWIAQEVDAQFENPASTPASRILATDRMDDLLKPHFPTLPGIYTYGFYWRNKVANFSGYSTRLLWNSQPGTNDPNNPIPPIRPVAYGGWTLCDIHQYSSTIVVCGRVRDHNYWFLEDTEMGMTPDETAWVQSIANKVKTLEMIVAGYGIDSDGDGVADLFGDEAIAWAYDPNHAWSALLGVTINTRDLALHVADPTGDIPDHEHTLGGNTGGVAGPSLVRTARAAGLLRHSDESIAALVSHTIGGVPQEEQEPDRGDPAERFNRE